jgi:hypothetical protein
MLPRDIRVLFKFIMQSSPKFSVYVNRNEWRMQIKWSPLGLFAAVTVHEDYLRNPITLFEKTSLIRKM